ncbi:MAG TPA: protein kinase [Thermoanaerobaculia bacterium]
MGEVWRARDPRLGRDVAVKVLPEDFLEGEEWKQRFEREARILASLNHPGIAAIHSFEEIFSSSSARHVLVMELVEGETLARRLASRPLPLEESLSLACQISAALEAAHAKGIVHRDLKPGNVMVSKEGRVKLLDFGLAKRTEALPADDVTSAPTASKQTAIGVVMGTLGYMSPEQARGLPVDERTDVWAFGCVLYEMLAGKKAFGGDSTADTLAAILTREPDWSALRAPVSSKVRELLARCLKRDPEERLSKIADAIPVLEGALSEAGRSGRRVPWLALGAAAAAVVALSVGGIWLSRRKPASPAAPSPASASPSIAVLPFANLSGDKEQEYFSDGLTEEVMGLLTRIKDLKVTGRTSAFAFKGKSEDLKAIGKTLNVATVLEGSVRRSGDRLRVAARLVNASDGYQVWAETYDRKMGDVFAVQDEIAGAVVAALKVKLLAGEVSASKVHHTPSPSAYEQYLLARDLLTRGEPSDFARARELLQEAVTIDSPYASAWALLAHTEYLLAEIAGSAEEIDEGRKKARALADKAIALDPGLAAGYVARGTFRVFSWDWAGAHADAAHALALNPGGSMEHVLKGDLLNISDKTAEAIVEFRKVLEIEPLLPYAWSALGGLLARSAQLLEARQAFSRALEIAPGLGEGHFGLGLTFLLENDPKAALIEFEKVSHEPFRLMGVAIAQHALGRSKESRGALDTLIARYAVNSAYQIALVYGRLGERDKTFEWLDRAYRQRDSGLAALLTARSFFYLDSLKADPRYTALLKKLNLPVGN